MDNQINFKISTELKERAIKQAKSLDLSLGSFARLALAEKIHEMEKD